VIQSQFRWVRANIRLPPLQAPSEPFNGYPNTNALLGGGRNRIRPMCGRDGESAAVPHCEDLWDDVGRSLPATACTTRPWRPLRRRAMVFERDGANRTGEDENGEVAAWVPVQRQAGRDETFGRIRAGSSASRPL
jgi:hypothetical protein